MWRIPLIRVQVIYVVNNIYFILNLRQKNSKKTQNISFYIWYFHIKFHEQAQHLFKMFCENKNKVNFYQKKKKLRSIRQCIYSSIKLKNHCLYKKPEKKRNNKTPTKTWVVLDVVVAGAPEWNKELKWGEKVPMYL